MSKILAKKRGIREPYLTKTDCNYDIGKISLQSFSISSLLTQIVTERCVMHLCRLSEIFVTYVQKACAASRTPMKPKFCYMISQRCTTYHFLQRRGTKGQRHWGPNPVQRQSSWPRLHKCHDQCQAQAALMLCACTTFGTEWNKISEKYWMS